MRYRKLRITWTVFCGIACLLLIVLWVRSYWWCDRLLSDPAANQIIVIESASGRLVLRDCEHCNYVLGALFEINDVPTDSPTTALTKTVEVIPGILHSSEELRGHYWVGDFQSDEQENRSRGMAGFAIYGTPFYTNYRVPYLFPVLLFAMFAVIPWLHWSKRFSVRSLLIATTLVAVVLGVVVWAVR